MDDCPKIYLNPDEDDYADTSPWKLSRSESLLYFLEGLFPYPAPRGVPRICPACHYINHADPWDCRCEPLPFQLLFISQVIRDEVLSLFYSESFFCACRAELGGLSGLFSFTKKALSQITSLTIRVNICSPTEDKEIGHTMLTNDWSACDYTTCQAPRSEDILQTSDYSKDPRNQEQTRTMAEWSCLCSHIAASIVPNRLRLSVACNTDDVVAKEFLGPLMSLPQLRECSIRLGARKYHEMVQLAAETVYKFTRQSTGHIERPFRFMGLPEEIRLQILMYTVLISFRDLACLPRGVPIARRVVEYHAVKQFSDTMFLCCRACSDTMEACCCWTRYAAASTTCLCWRLPTEFLLVSKQFCKYATEIFFSKNTFVVIPESFVVEPEMGRMRTQDSSLETYRFLTRTPELGRQHLRYEQWGSYHFFIWGCSRLGVREPWRC